MVLPFGRLMRGCANWEQVRLEHPESEWTIHNAWFVRQLDFRTTFHRRELVQPVESEKM